MRSGNLRGDILLNTIKADAANGTTNATEVIHRQFPCLSEKECAEIEEIIKLALTNENQDKFSLVATTPPSFKIDAKPTMMVVRSMIENANESILITGYSLSSYFSELTDIIIDKSQKGVLVRFFINDIEKQPNTNRLMRYRGRFLRIYDYTNQDDRMAAMHAKVISTDAMRTLITSANLSYHGQQGNIELGIQIQSNAIARQLDDVFTQLIYKKIFREI